MGAPRSLIVEWRMEEGVKPYSLDLLRRTQTAKMPGLTEKPHGEFKQSGFRPSVNVHPFPGWLVESHEAA